MHADRVTDEAFAALMAALGPFGSARRVVAGVSGGADSMALAWLLSRWGAPLAVVVDHGLRADSAAEAALTVERLAGFGVVGRVERLDLRPGSDLGARARAARYAALLLVCRAEGLPDLVVGHHAQDQAETVVLRARAGSGAAGLAGMGAVSWRGDARVLRPLLGVAPGRLRTTLRAAGVPWVEDPTNADPGTARGALRGGPLPRPDAGAGARRTADEAALAAMLGHQVSMHPGGYAEVRGELPEAGWAALIWTISGRAYPPRLEGVRRLVRAGGGTLHGVVVRGGVVGREAAGAPVPAGAMWDGRFAVDGAIPGATVSALGAEAARLRRRPGPPAFVLRALPAVRQDGKLLAVPHLPYPCAKTCLSVRIGFRPARPLAGAPFFGG